MFYCCSNFSCFSNYIEWFLLFYWVKTPQYSLKIIKEYVEKHDVIMFKKYVATDKLCGQVVESILNQRFSNEGENNPITQNIIIDKSKLYSAELESKNRGKETTNSIYLKLSLQNKIDKPVTINAFKLQCINNDNNIRYEKNMPLKNRSITIAPNKNEPIQGQLLLNQFSGADKKLINEFNNYKIEVIITSIKIGDRVIKYQDEL